MAFLHHTGIRDSPVHARNAACSSADQGERYNDRSSGTDMGTPPRTMVSSRNPRTSHLDGEHHQHGRAIDVLLQHRARHVGVAGGPGRGAAAAQLAVVEALGLLCVRLVPGGRGAHTDKQRSPPRRLPERVSVCRASNLYLNGTGRGETVHAGEKKTPPTQPNIAQLARRQVVHCRPDPYHCAPHRLRPCRYTVATPTTPALLLTTPSAASRRGRRATPP